jgi:hypothetical protein
MRIARKVEGDLTSLMAPLAEPLHVVLPPNHELTVAQVGDDLDIVAVCAHDGADVRWAGMFVTTADEFMVADDSGGMIPADAYGFLPNSEVVVDGPNGHGRIAVPSLSSQEVTVVDRPVVTDNGETFSFGVWTVMFVGDECEITAPITFGTNGSDVDMYPDGEEPVMLPVDEDTFNTPIILPEELQWWLERTCPWC